VLFGLLAVGLLRGLVIQHPAHPTGHILHHAADLVEWGDSQLEQPAQKAVSTHNLHPLYLTIMATLRNTDTTSQSPPHTICRRDRKKIRGPTTEYKGIKLILTRSTSDN
jgi:hypothetical protein